MSGVNRQYRQVTCKRTITGSAFSGGIMDFDFSVGGNTIWIPSKSYFRIGLELKAEDTVPVVAKNIAYANMVCGNLFDNIYFQAGGQPVSGITGYAPQAHACVNRLKKTGAWMASLGKDAYGMESSFPARRNKIASDGQLIDNPADQTLAQDPGHNYPVDEPNKNVRYFIYQPPIGIMEYDQGMGSGNYRFQFNPNADYKTACVQALTSKAVGVGVNDFDFNVTSMELYICTEKKDVSPTGTQNISLLEHQVQSKTLNAGEQNLDFTVPSSTRSVSLFVQSGKAGTNTLVPPSSFITINDAGNGPDTAQRDRSLRSFQITYANVTKPPTRWTSEYTGSTNKLQQRYLDTQIESNMAFASGGCETLPMWLENGPIIHYNWARDSSDQSTQLQVQIDYAAMEAGANLFLVAHYSRKAQIDVQNGFVANVVTLSV